MATGKLGGIQKPHGQGGVGGQPNVHSCPRGVAQWALPLPKFCNEIWILWLQMASGETLCTYEHHLKF